MSAINTDTDKNFYSQLRSIKQGRSVMGECFYPMTKEIEGLQFQRGENHYLVNSLLYVRGERKLKTIKKAIEIAEIYQQILSHKISFFDFKKTYQATISYGDPYKLGGFQETFSGTPSEIKQKASDLEDSMWEKMNRNGNPYVSIKINGVKYSKNLRLSFTEDWSLQKIISCLHQDIITEREVSRFFGSPSSSDIILALANLSPNLSMAEVKKIMKWKNGQWQIPNQSVIWDSSHDLRETWYGLTLV